MGEVANFEGFADALKRQAREVSYLRGAKGGGGEGGDATDAD